MQGIVITSKPIMDGAPASLLIQTSDDQLRSMPLSGHQAVTVEILQAATRYCTGWYDVSTHQCHICPQRRKVELKVDTCYDCRQRTGFNPAFYNADQISPIQQAYNCQPHSVYVAYFGNGVAKAGIMSDSRGLERLYEQGALLYVLVDSLPNADMAHGLEEDLIQRGLRNSVTKKQKEDVWRSRIDIASETDRFQRIIQKLQLKHEALIVNNLQHFFYGSYPSMSIQPIPANEPISGRIAGVVGRYLVLMNEGRLHGCWLTKLTGYKSTVVDEYCPIAPSPLQASLF